MKPSELAMKSCSAVAILLCAACLGLGAIACDPAGPCTDGDADGFTLERGCGTAADCDDADPGVNPGAVESAAAEAVCGGGLDNDCDERVDDEEPGWQPCTTDADCDDGNECTDDLCPDGYCASAYSTDPCDDRDPCTANDACSAGACAGTLLDADGDGYAGGSCGGDDCDDADPGVHPAAAEGPAGDATCGDGLDNDCDGRTDAGGDEGCDGLVPGIRLGTVSPLSVVRFEEDPLLSPFTLFVNGYREGLLGDKASQVVLLHNDTGLALWTYEATELGGLNFAHSAALDGDEMLLSDTQSDRVLIVRAGNGIYSASPDFELVWNSREDTAIDLDYPNDADFLASGNLLITDRDHHRVIEVDRATGGIVWQFGVTGQSGSDDAHLDGPHNADRLASGDTIVADSNNRRILVVRENGSVAWAYQPGGTDRLNWPRDADWIGDGNVLITDSNNGRVLEADSAGNVVWQYRMSIIGTLSVPYEADLLLNGNVLVSCPGARDGGIYEVDHDTLAVLWKFP